MKRTGICTATASVLVVLCLLMSISGCDHGSSGSSKTGKSLQSQIDAALAGSTVTLNASYTGTSISISKALTVNGSGIQNLSITVNAEVADNVTLTNFPNASLTITGGAQPHSAVVARSAFAARSASGGDDEGAGPKELGDDNPRIILENSSFDSITAEDDVTLILGNDEQRVVVDELTVTGRADEFVLIENDGDDTADGDKSRISTLTVEAGVSEVDLIGGRFDDLEFTGDFSDKVDFYYDKYGEQAAADFKARLAEAAAQANELDVCAVRNGSGVYKVTVPKASIEAAQGEWEYDGRKRGSIFIMLLTDEQKAAFLASIPDGTNPEYPSIITVIPKDDLGWYWASIDQPYFDVGYTGTYLFNTDDEGLYAVSGDADSLYVAADDYYECFDNYRCYSPDAICSDCSGEDFTIWLDVSKLRKSDLNTCAYKADGYTDEYYCTPNKLTEIDLAGYTPYIAIDIVAYTELAVPDGNSDDVEQALEDAKTFFGEAINTTQIMTPVSKGNNGAGIGIKCVYMFPMNAATAYPSEAVWEQIPCPPQPQY